MGVRIAGLEAKSMIWKRAKVQFPTLISNVLHLNSVELLLLYTCPQIYNIHITKNNKNK